MSSSEKSSLQQLVVYLHNKRKAAHSSGPSVHGQSSSSDAAHHPPVCWLCETRPPSPFTLNEALPLCLSCFHLTYDALLRPLLFVSSKSSRGEFIGQLLSKLVKIDNTSSSSGEGLGGGDVIVEPSQANFVLAASHSRRMMMELPADVGGPAAADRPRESSSRNRRQKQEGAEALPSCWSCPRCTFYNPTSTRLCDACGCAQPQQLSCEGCQKDVCCYVQSAADVCTSTGRRHAPWHCQSCTVINVLDGDVCFLCRSSRKWQCSRCSFENVSKTATGDNNRFCACCGTPAPSKGSGTIMNSSREAAQEEEQQRRFAEAKRRLTGHLNTLGVKVREQTGDGNCLFRSLSQQVFNCPQHHMLVRHVTTDYVERNSDKYACLFDGPDELQEYLRSMRAAGTWGDEVMLHAAAQWLGLHVHVITSDDKRWHLTFTPTAPSTASSRAAAVSSDTILVGIDGSDASVRCLSHSASHEESEEGHIFLAYLYPTHYDSVQVPLPFALDPSAALLRALRCVEAEEMDWVRLMDADLQLADDVATPEDSSWVRV